jgi:hypothetical protein
MTNQFPDATKMVLSTAAQAILNAYGRETGDIDCVWHPSELKGLAAALHAAVDQIEPEDGIPSEVQHVLDKLLAIADELGAQP